MSAPEKCEMTPISHPIDSIEFKPSYFIFTSRKLIPFRKFLYVYNSGTRSQIPKILMITTNSCWFAPFSITVSDIALYEVSVKLQSILYFPIGLSQSLKF